MVYGLDTDHVVEFVGVVFVHVLGECQLGAGGADNQPFGDIANLRNDFIKVFWMLESFAGTDAVCAMVLVLMPLGGVHYHGWLRSVAIERDDMRFAMVEPDNNVVGLHGVCLLGK